jgi:hypothetical protein
MPIDFPDTPTVGQIFTAGDASWIWNGSVWNSNSLEVDITTLATIDYVDLEVSSLDSSKQDVVSGVSSTEIGYLDGVTSSIQTQINNKEPLFATINTVSTNYTLQLSDISGIVEVDTAATITVPEEGTTNFPIGTSIDIVNLSIGEVLISQDPGVLISSKDDASKITSQYSAATIYKRAANEWVLIGDISV